MPVGSKQRTINNLSACHSSPSALHSALLPVPCLRPGLHPQSSHDQRPRGPQPGGSRGAPCEDGSCCEPRAPASPGQDRPPVRTSRQSLPPPQMGPGEPPAPSLFAQAMEGAPGTGDGAGGSCACQRCYAHFKLKAKLQSNPSDVSAPRPAGPAAARALPASTLTPPPRSQPAHPGSAPASASPAGRADPRPSSSGEHKEARQARRLRSQPVPAVTGVRA